MNPKKNPIVWIFVIVLLSLAAACAPKTNPFTDIEKASQALEAFFDRLSNRDYAAAAKLYGGSYDTLVSFNPDLNPSETSALWQSGCQINGLQCLAVRTVKFSQQSGTEFIFDVEFNNSDGSLFVQGPCCGADESKSPDISQFQVRVQKTDQGQFLVLDMPVYVP